jgi:hypothetical protein
MIIFASTAFTDFMVNAEVPKKLVAITQENVESKVVFLLAINIILLIVGSVMDIFSAIVVVLPLVAPIAKAYGIDPYHLGVIFLLNLEVGYLHPPVGLNLFLTSVKFNRPITEVMWATVPFLVTMLVALIVITYVPGITAVSVPEPPRNAPVMNLVSMVETGIEESKVSVAQITLVDALGNEIKGPDGKPVVRLFRDCAKITEESERTICQELFFKVTTCRPNAKTADPKQIACSNRAVAAWTVANMNGDALHPEYALTTMTELPLVDADGKPIEIEIPKLDANGSAVVDADGDEVKEKKAVVGKDGKPVVKKLATCEPLTGSSRDTCRSLFVDVSNCTISPPGAESCAEGAPAECGAGSPEAPAPAPGPGSGSASGSGSAAGSGSGAAAPATGPGCIAEKTATCVKKSIATCALDKMTTWLTDNPDRAFQD